LKWTESLRLSKYIKRAAIYYHKNTITRIFDILTRLNVHFRKMGAHNTEFSSSFVTSPSEIRINFRHRHFILIVANTSHWSTEMGGEIECVRENPFWVKMFRIAFPVSVRVPNSAIIHFPCFYFLPQSISNACRYLKDFCLDVYIFNIISSAPDL
jgi:hypothetical protein